MIKRIVLILFLAGISTVTGFSQDVGLKVNLLYGATATPNLGLELGLGKRTSLDFLVGYNPFNNEALSSTDNIGKKKLVHVLVQPEFRYWLCERFNGHFFGLHGTYASYNIAKYDIPGLFEKEWRYEGYAVGAGLGYGYHWIWNKHWGMEFNVGVGYLYMKYDKYPCKACVPAEEENVVKHYFGPTKAGISLVFVF